LRHGKVSFNDRKETIGKLAEGLVGELHRIADFGPDSYREWISDFGLRIVIADCGLRITYGELTSFGCGLLHFDLVRLRSPTAAQCIISDCGFTYVDHLIAPVRIADCGFTYVELRFAPVLPAVEIKFCNLDGGGHFDRMEAPLRSGSYLTVVSLPLSTTALSCCALTAFQI